MRKDVRFRLHFGPYKTTRFRYGATVAGEWRGDVQIVGLFNGQIPRLIEMQSNKRSLVVIGALARAICRKPVRTVNRITACCEFHRDRF